ncbi:MAG TPA: phosphoribosylamine--glycine ligase, partial [Acidimicrobiia bacterium]|nr:phosphoribosylamine--glycine ligase [Acidimicrobiia bacterium]
MRALVIGGDGRAHALVWALDNAASVDEVVAGPGNPGIAAMGKRCVAVDATDPADVGRLAGEVEPDVVVVSAEEPLVHGVADSLRSRGTLVFGPGADGARLEGSKAWMKAVLAEAGVPTARHAAFTADQEAEALAFLERLPGFYVVKTDGLAAGKGVIVTESIDEARDAVRAYLSGQAFGAAGRTCVIEEGLTGPELSLLVVCNGTTEGRPLAPAQDFKRIGDGDRGPNTGGMGAYSPVPVAGGDVVTEVMEHAVTPTLRALA